MHAKELERTVAAFEHVLSRHPGISIKSPGYVTDRHTGKPREVDVLITGTIGSVPVFCIAECRAHKRKQGVQWIEQVANKKEGLGASEAFAVSSSGFTAPALVKAEKLGIRTRTLEDLDSLGIEAILAKRKVIGTQRRFAMKDISFNVTSTVPLGEMSRPGLHDEFVVDRETKTRHSIVSLLDSEWSDLQEVLHGPDIEEGAKAPVKFSVNLPPERFGFIGQGDQHYVGGVVVKAEAYDFVTPGKIRFAQAYDVDGKLMHRLGYDIDFPHGTLEAELYAEDMGLEEGWRLHGTSVREHRKTPKTSPKRPDDSPTE